jgi:hypothetical protein
MILGEDLGLNLDSVSRDYAEIGHAMYIYSTGDREGLRDKG